MGKVIEVKFNRFDGGISDSPRQQQVGVFRASKNFDIYKDQNKLAPVRSWKADETYADSNIGMRPYNLKVISSGFFRAINAIGTKADGTGSKYFSKPSPTAPSWISENNFDTVPAALESTHLAEAGFLINKDGYVWHITSTTNRTFWHISNIDYNTPPVVYNPAVQILIGMDPSLPVPSGFVHADNRLYVGFSNYIYKCNPDGTVNTNALTLPSGSVITSITNFGNYLAIAAYRTNPQHISYVYLWDAFSPSFTEQINWGEGIIRVLENLNGVLVGVTDRYISDNNLGNDTGSMVIKTWSGGTSPETRKEVYAASASSSAPISQSKAVKGDNLLFYAKIPANQEATEFNEGIWSFGRKNSNSPYALCLYTETPGTSLDSFTGYGEFLYAAHSGNGSISRTDDQPVYGLTSVWESQIIGDADTEHSARGGTVSFEPLTSNQSVTLKYRKDRTVDWVPVKTENTPGKLSFHYAGFSTTFREMELRIEATGGAAVTKIKFKYEELTDGI